MARNVIGRGGDETLGMREAYSTREELPDRNLLSPQRNNDPEKFTDIDLNSSKGSSTTWNTTLVRDSSSRTYQTADVNLQSRNSTNSTIPSHDRNAGS